MNTIFTFAPVRLSSGKKGKVLVFRGGKLTDASKIQPSGLEGKKILVVDDVVDNQMLESYYLKKEGAQVEVASNGLEAIEKALNGQHDAILMDLHMPLLDGLSATAKLRHHGYKKPIIAVTADVQISVRKRALQVGFNDFVVKPLSQLDLIGSLKKFCLGGAEVLTPH